MRTRATAKAEPASRPKPAKRKTAAARPARTPPQRGVTPPRRASFTGRAAVLAIVLGILILSYAYPLRTWFEQRSRITSLEQQQTTLQGEVESLEKRQQQLRDPAYVRAQARERLNFVLPGEVGFIVTEPEEAAAAAIDGPTVAAAAGAGPWWQRLWASVEAADAASDGIAPGQR